jgi:hypothetical protein
MDLGMSVSNSTLLPARIAENGFATSSGMNKSAKVVLMLVKRAKIDGL